MIDIRSLLIGLAAVLIWALARFVILPRILNRKIFNELSHTKPQLTRKFVLVRMGIATIVLLSWAVLLIGVAGGIGQENNKYFFEAILLIVGLIWTIGLVIVQRI